MSILVNYFVYNNSLVFYLFSIFELIIIKCLVWYYLVFNIKKSLLVIIITYISFCIFQNLEL